MTLTPTLEWLSFVDSVLEGQSKIEHIEQWIDFWHTNNVNMELYDFLGFREDEYAHFVQDSNFINHVLKMRLH